MDPKKKALTAVVAGTVLGIGGLAVIAMPASAGAAPVLPAISAENLVQSVATAKTPALSGKVAVTNNLGLPSLNFVPGAASALSLDSADVYNDGNGRSKVALHQGDSQQTITRDGTTVWQYNSKDNSVNKMTVPADGQHKTPDGTDRMADPTTAATDLLSTMRETSTVTVDGTARVADRPAYELVLTPKPTERTLLREVRVAVDSETRLPLQLEVLTNGSSDPALKLGFTQIQFTPQSASEFQFTPPKGAKVTESQPKADNAQKGQIDKAQQDVKVVGDGWDTVLSGKIPADMLSGKAAPSDKAPAFAQGKALDPKALLSRVGKPVSGTWGSGYVITTKVVTAIVTDDGRFAAGAVPQQVLFEALAAK
jgi:outer membrane lipoprotein-sorting protein